MLLVIRAALLRASYWDHRGIYPEDKGGDELPARMRFLHPDANEALEVFETEHPGVIYFTDMYRSAAESLRAVKAKRKGVAMPGWSVHTFALAFDCAVERTLRRGHWSYTELLIALAKVGFYCHRRDGDAGHESWHFNFLGPHAEAHLATADRSDPDTWAKPGESRIRELYGDLTLTLAKAQLALAKAGFDPGPADGVIGPRSRAAIAAFRAVWNMSPAGGLTTRCQRLLAVVTADFSPA